MREDIYDVSRHKLQNSAFGEAASRPDNSPKLQRSRRAINGAAHLALLNKGETYRRPDPLAITTAPSVAWSDCQNDLPVQAGRAQH